MQASHFCSQNTVHANSACLHTYITPYRGFRRFVWDIEWYIITKNGLVQFMSCLTRLAIGEEKERKGLTTSTDRTERKIQKKKHNKKRLGTDPTFHLVDTSPTLPHRHFFSRWLFDLKHTKQPDTYPTAESGPLLLSLPPFSRTDRPAFPLLRSIPPVEFANETRSHSHTVRIHVTKKTVPNGRVLHILCGARRHLVLAVVVVVTSGNGFGGSREGLTWLGKSRISESDM